MTRTTALLAVVLLALAPGVVLAQSAADLALTAARIHAGWYDTGDFGNGPGFGLDLLNEVEAGRWTLGFEWRDLDPPVYEPIDTDAKGAFGVKACYGFSLGFELDAWQQDVWDGFFGVAGTWHSFINAQDDGAFGGRVYLGAEAGSRRQFEGAIGYDLREGVFDGWDSNGLFGRLGYRFRF